MAAATSALPTIDVWDDKDGNEAMTTARTIEIRAAEGGEDSRLFVAELAAAYIRLAEREN